MIIDPVLNQRHLDLPQSNGQLDVGLPVIQDVSFEVFETAPVSEDHPPPYTEIDPGITEGPETNVPKVTVPESSQWEFTRGHIDSNPQPSNSKAVASPGMQEIQDGANQILDSTMLVAETVLTATGSCTQGVGRILSGLGKIIKDRRTAWACKGQ